MFALGCVLHEMLSGRSPFARGSRADTFAAILAAEAPAVDGPGTKLPRSVATALTKCLAKDPGARYADASPLLADLDAVCREMDGPPPIEARSIVASLRRPAIAIPLLLIVAAAGFGIYRWNERRAREAWARQIAIPEAQRLLGENRRFEAYELALEARAAVGADPAIAALWPQLTTPYRVTTDPPGANLSYRPYPSASPGEGAVSAGSAGGSPIGSAGDFVAGSAGAQWRALGQTPYLDDHFPVGAFRFRIEKEGFEPVEVARSLLPGDLLETLNPPSDYLADPSYALDVKLSPAGSLPDGMLSVDGGRYLNLPLRGTDAFASREVPAFLIDRTEVTNAAYREFVGAGGYSDAQHWREPFERDGETVPTAAAMVLFRDSTSRPGPATWVLGAPPDRTESLPVSGVSWFEAAAYCRWRGMALPTLYHWARAAIPSSEVWTPFTPVLVEASNYGGVGPVAVASRPGIGVSGAYDLAGNVREWVSTAAGTRRYLSWRRVERSGLLRQRAERDHAALGSLPYQRLPLCEVSGGRSAGAAAGSDRPAAAGLLTGSADAGTGVRDHKALLRVRPHSAARSERRFVAATRVGRRRGVGFDRCGLWRRAASDEAAPASSFDELVVHWAQDLGRVIDYLEQRPDLDATKVAFAGMSLGAILVPNLLAFEPRVQAAILWSGGFGVPEDQPSIDGRIGLARRVTVPILMLGGSRDSAVPVDPNQRALFRFFGTPEQDKRMQIFEGAGHWPLPMNDVIRESVDFLDRYLGPVTSGP